MRVGDGVIGVARRSDVHDSTPTSTATRSQGHGLRCLARGAVTVGDGMAVSGSDLVVLVLTDPEADADTQSHPREVPGDRTLSDGSDGRIGISLAA